MMRLSLTGCGGAYRARPDPFRVEPPQPLIEHRTRLVLSDVDRQDTERGGKRRSHAGFVESREGEGTIALAELGAICCDYKGKVGVRRGGQLEGLLQGNLPRGR